MQSVLSSHMPLALLFWDLDSQKAVNNAALGFACVLLGSTIFYSDKPPVFGPCRLLDFELEMVRKKAAGSFRFVNLNFF